jgi:hypothetical protein
MNKDRVFRRDINSQQPRNSSQNTVYSSKPPTNQPQTLSPTYIKIAPPPPSNQSTNVNRQSNNTTGGYLEPINSSKQNNSTASKNAQDGYLQPSNNQNNQSAYLEPSKPPPKANEDTYGGVTNNNKKIAVQIPITVEKESYLNQPSVDTYLMPTSSNRPQSNSKDFEYIDDDQSDTYLLPRHGSNMSSTSTNSTYLQPTSKYTLLDKNRLSAKDYVPPPMTGGNKLSTFRTINETDV